MVQSQGDQLLGSAKTGLLVGEQSHYSVRTITVALIWRGKVADTNHYVFPDQAKAVKFTVPKSASASHH